MVHATGTVVLPAQFEQVTVTLPELQPDTVQAIFPSPPQAVQLEVILPPVQELQVFLLATVFLQVPELDDVAPQVVQV